MFHELAQTSSFTLCSCQTRVVTIPAALFLIFSNVFIHVEGEDGGQIFLLTTPPERQAAWLKRGMC